MMNFFQHIVNQKVLNTPPSKLKQIGEEYGVYITEQQATMIVQKIREKPFDVFNENERKRFLSEVAQVTSPEVAAKAESLFQQMIG